MPSGGWDGGISGGISGLLQACAQGTQEVRLSPSGRAPTPGEGALDVQQPQEARQREKLHVHISFQLLASPHNPLPQLPEAAFRSVLWELHGQPGRGAREPALT